jgi:hypothetical protein
MTHMTTVTQTIEKQLSKFTEDELQPRLNEVKARLRKTNKDVLAFIKERPGTSLLCALAGGYLIGRLVRR